MSPQTMRVHVRDLLAVDHEAESAGLLVGDNDCALRISLRAGNGGHPPGYKRGCEANEESQAAE
jgi:hypothetical protein